MAKGRPCLVRRVAGVMRPVLGLWVALALALPGHPVAAQSGPGTAAAAALDLIVGFRSARFGMTEDEVLAALQRDFGEVAASAERRVNPLERTTVLALTVPDLLPDGGPARVLYLFGHRSHRLIQVNLAWEAADAAGPNRERLTANGTMLRAYFEARHYLAGTVFADRRLPDGTVLLFTASDPNGRQVTLTLSAPAGPVVPAAEPVPVEPAPAGPETTAATRPAASLRLSYVLAPANPDVYRLPLGAF